VIISASASVVSIFKWWRNNNSSPTTKSCFSSA